ncbi:hypothetical protein CONLIGDRAFT_562909, partial [Coniochaeta ligniaria NRRL 30616]
MGAVVSCIQNLFRTIGNCIMAVVSGIGGILTAIINGIVSFIGILVSFLTCGYCGGRRRGHASTGRHHTTTT